MTSFAEGKTKRIISHHDFSGTPTDLGKLHDRLLSLDPDIVKIFFCGRSALVKKNCK